MRYITARQMWHDAFNDSLSPDLKAALLNLPRGTAHDNDTKIWHQVMAGKVQAAVHTLPPHLRDWGMLCFAPDRMQSVEQYRRVENELWRQFKEAGRYDGQRSIGQMILCRLAVEQQIHRERSGLARFTQSDCYGRLAIGRNDWNRHSWRVDWERLNDLIADWTGWALEPVAKLRLEMEETFSQSS